MLDSLVRVSRRVGGDADLLAPEKDTAQDECARKTSALSSPPGPKSERRGLPSDPKAAPRTSPAPKIQAQRFGA